MKAFEAYNQGKAEATAAERERWMPVIRKITGYLNLVGICLICSAQTDPGTGMLEHEDDCVYANAIKETNDE